MITSYASIRDSRSRLLREHVRYDPPYGLVARLGDADTPKAELLRVWNPDLTFDPKFYLLTDEHELAVLGQTGLVESYRKGGEVHVERTNAYGFTRPRASLERILDAVYATIGQMAFEQFEERDVFAWRAQSVLARFGDFRALYDERDIVPEYNDTMMVVKLSEGCKRSCSYCPEGGGLVRYSAEKITANMRLARKLEEKHHGAHIGLMTEGFLNTSDLLWFRGHDPNPLAIIKEYVATFPEVEKLYTFMGVPTVLATPVKELEAMGEAGLGRILVGIESFHHATSRFLGKAEPAEDKVAAIEKLYRIGFKVKPIVQVGAVGRGFEHNGVRYTGREGLEETARVAAKLVNMDLRNKRPRVKLLVSRYVPVPGTRLVDDPRVVRYEREGELEEDVAFFLAALWRNGARRDLVELDYEAAINGGLRREAA